MTKKRKLWRNEIIVNNREYVCRRCGSHCRVEWEGMKYPAHYRARLCMPCHNHMMERPQQQTLFPE